MSLGVLLDTETTGINLKKNDIWQIAGFILDGVEIIDEFDIKFQPFPGTTYDAGALEKTKMTIEDFDLFQSNEDGYREFIAVLTKHIDKFNKLDKCHLIAYNAKFDSDFIRAWFKKYHNNYYGAYFWSNNIDIMTLAGEFLKSIRPKMPNFKLETVYRVLCSIGLLEPLKSDNYHDAMFDIQVELAVYNLFRIENIRQTIDSLKGIRDNV